MDSVGSRLNLQDTGTRFDHYMELKEVFMLGIEVIKGMRPGFASDIDKTTKVKLEHAVEVINKRIEYLSDYGDKAARWSDFGRQIDLIKPHVTPLLTAGGCDAKPEPKIASLPNDSEIEGNLS